MTALTRRKKYNLLIAQAKGFWDVYKRNKKGIFGIGLIVFFVLLLDSIMGLRSCGRVNTRWK